MLESTPGGATYEDKDDVTAAEGRHQQLNPEQLNPGQLNQSTSYRQYRLREADNEQHS